MLWYQWRVNQNYRQKIVKNELFLKKNSICTYIVRFSYSLFMLELSYQFQTMQNGS